MSDPPTTQETNRPTSAQKYKALVEEAYIGPVRTVIAVDDDFPSLDTVLHQLVAAGKTWSGDLAAARTVLDLISYCRRRPSPWLVDVHDGATPAGETIPVPQIHQSDLIILDYHLSGEEGGEKAVMLLRRLASDGNFNLIVVYTKGFDGEIRRVFWDIVEGLTFSTRQQTNPERITETNSALRAWEDTDSGITGRLQDLVSREVYLAERAGLDSIRADVLPALVSIAKTAPAGVSVNASLLYDWTLNWRHEEILPLLSQADLGRIGLHFSESANWIKTDQMFITVISKQTQPSDIEAALLEALVKSRPSPYQLLMAKMRAQMEARGSDAEAEVLRDTYLQAGWLRGLVSSEQTDRKGLLKTTVDRHWEALGQELRGEIDHYAGRLAEYVEERGEEEVLKEYIPQKVSAEGEKILAHLNCYNCAKPEVERSHLTTGHIIELSSADQSSTTTYWICLSPACDLVPGQKQTAASWFGRLGSFMPFTAVKLHKSNQGTAIEKANSNSFVFFRIRGEIQAYTFHPNADISLNPAWEQMFAADQGRFIAGSQSVNICRVAGAADSLNIVGPDRAEIVAQLRYEYALNLLQRLGNTLSRVGLDFTAQTKQNLNIGQ